MHHAETHALYKVPPHKRHKVHMYVKCPLGVALQIANGPGYSFPYCQGVKIRNIWYTNSQVFGQE